MMRSLALGLALACLGFAPLPFVRHMKPAATLDGTWRQAAVDGKPVPPGMRNLTTIEISGTRWAFQGAGGRVYSLAVDRSAKPATFDLRNNPADPKPYGQGIWRLEGDELRIAYGWNTERPKDFEPKGANVFYFTLRRLRK